MFRTDVQVEQSLPTAQAAAIRNSGEVPQPRRTRGLPDGCDVAILGGGMAGMATALRLQAAGLSTVVIEAHGHAGGCAGYFRHQGFSFDVGATTLVDFEDGGVGAELLGAAGMPPLDGEALPGYVAWLPDRTVTLHRDRAAWHAERLRSFGDSPQHRRFWALLDSLADAFWEASRRGVRLPIRRPADLLHDVRAIGLRNLPLGRHLAATLGGTLQRHGLRDDDALVGLLGMLVEDTVHTSVDRAPLINAALGVTIRGAGLTRHRGGMHGFWRALVAQYRALGGVLVTGCRAEQVTGQADGYRVHTTRGTLDAGQVVSALPAENTMRLTGSLPVAGRLAPYVRRDAPNLGGAIVVFLGVPGDQVAGQVFTHHQLLQDYAQPLGEGNNMFVSVSADGDTVSAPAGHRAVMISTHTELADWNGADELEYQRRKHEIGERLIAYARRAYPDLADPDAGGAVVRQVGTPRSYARFALRPAGAVGGARQTLANTNQFAIPHDLGVPGFWVVGDSTWPGLGTVACVLGSRIVADGVLRAGSRSHTFASRTFERSA